LPEKGTGKKNHRKPRKSQRSYLKKKRRFKGKKRLGKKSIETPMGGKVGRAENYQQKQVCKFFLRVEEAGREISRKKKACRKV